MQSIVTLTITDPASVTQLTVNDAPVAVTLTVQDSKGEPGASAYDVWLADGNAGPRADFLASIAPVSPQPDNRLKMLDDGLHVLDELIPDPLAYYILARG